MTFRVVLVDDSEEVRAVWHQVLQRALEFEVVGRAGDGIEGLAACRARRPEAVVTEWEMPHLNGVDFARQLRAEQPDVAIVVCSCRRVSDVPAELAALGIAFLDKTHSNRLPQLLLHLLARNSR